ncbi:MAG: hypothetical protein HY226_03310 [Candidatus Vogelbacteria bacterium]|nr:hypothetical protein [Candidatus Vogelbacteria bacterium]
MTNRKSVKIFLKKAVLARPFIVPKRPMLVILFMFLLFLVYSTYRLYRINDSHYIQELADSKLRDIVTEVGKVMILPSDIPRVALVSDSDRMKKSESFFEKTKNGDEFLMFRNMAVLYRPSEHKIVNVSSVTRQ